MKTIRIRYGCGYGTHTAEIEVEDDCSSEEIEEQVSDYARERFWWSWEDGEAEE